ncbi:MAG: tetratricopeptide repeat protein [Candidatus Delongbacteria bacterium]|nr:tetratricopeptide repeat protein [Candidatus Delongbacteria bacterium]
MKRRRWFGLTVVSVLLIIACAQKPAESIEPGTWQTHYDEVIKAAQSNPKPIIADFYTDWCSWCKKMDSTTFQDSTVLTFLKDYYLLKINAEQDTLTAKKYGIVAYPTLVLMDASGNEIDRLHYAEPAEFIKIIRDYQSGIGTLADFLNQQREHPDSLDLVYKIADKYQSRGDKSNAKLYFEQILTLDPKNQAGFSDNALLEIGHCFRRAKDFDSALVYFSRYLTDFPSDSLAPDAQIYLGLVSLKKGDTEGARRYWEEFLTKFPTSNDTTYVKKKLAELEQ